VDKRGRGSWGGVAEGVVDENQRTRGAWQEAAAQTEAEFGGRWEMVMVWHCVPAPGGHASEIKVCKKEESAKIVH
jgi:hypothetical protein